MINEGGTSGLAERSRAIVEALPDSIFVISASGDILDFKLGEAVDLFGTAEEVVGKKLEKVFSTEVADQFYYYVQQAIQTKTIQVCEFKLTRQKETIEFEARFTGYDENTVLVIVRNITSRKKAESNLVAMMLQLEESHDNLISILNLLRLGSVMLDKDGTITFLSQAGCKLLGLKDDVIGKKWDDVFPISDQEKYQIQRMFELSPKKRLNIPVNIKFGKDRNDWIDIEIQDHPQESHKKIFLLYDVTEVHQLRRMLDEKTDFQGLVGQSRVMKHVCQQIRELADVDVSVLVQGETGTGKEVVARALHNLSSRRNKPFIAVNCAGLTTGSLLASQLFGHKRGAFTGAVQDQKGFLEAADGGTLFLDEIGDIPADVQTNLLRFLQDKEIVRIGESKPIKVDVRIISASQHDLLEEVNKGLFRTDLYYRIHVAKILLPALRERREDIPLLAIYFLEESRERTKKNVLKISAEAMQILIQHSYPGNVRELQAIIDAAVIRCGGDVIEVQDLPEGILQGISMAKTPKNEKQRILSALDQTSGNRSAAAKLLGMSRATFYRRLESLEIP